MFETQRATIIAEVVDVVAAAETIVSY